MKKVLNLYAGIGGNRKLWEDVDVTAIENNPEIAKIYQDFFPNDKVFITDARQYLLEHFKKYDFIWSSPPCPSHSRIRFYTAINRGQSEPIYPDMKLYEGILFLDNYFNGNWVVENVIGFYKPLIPCYKIGRHYFWSNFYINNIKTRSGKHLANNEELQMRKGFNLDKYKIKIDKKLLLRNCVEPELGLHIFKSGLKNFEIIKSKMKNIKRLLPFKE